MVLQIPYTIDLLIVTCIFIGAFLALTQCYVEDKVFKTISWLVDLILGVSISAVSWLHLYLLAPIYLVVILLAFLVVYYPILNWAPNLIKQRKAQSFDMMSDEELEIYSRLEKKYGYGFTRLHVRIIVAMKRGRRRVF